ncbi:hypothetical protein BGZ61DRAFT_466529 [Ilyonectria robusta]|uniref:uncharacterized protein n=1 Tax=Ilyonectria robusta TaxID=1079257 RepID=UPI001E8CD88F|nr:uncharacterized protein BGZ61DRAFT_466529 [Ilyonectria robusta]KAH8656454.1 hypothetical protein BGZ61DRAFT_466529 [Ilyonectria robusta]
MASTDMATATLSVDEIAAMGDAELGMFMKKHRRPGGGFELPVDGWDKLSKDERNRLAERLKAQERGLAQSPTACSRPLDLDDLDARLRQVSPNNSFSLRPELKAIERSESPTPPFDLEVHRTRDEIESYHELIDDGGRPLYPIDVIQDVYRNPNNYAEILRPWQESLTQIRPGGIFQRQLQRWQDFRKWQNDNRGREDDDGGFPAYVEQQKHWIKRDCLKETRARRLAEIEADPSCLKPEWDQMQLLRRRQRRLYRERDCDGFHDYAAAVKRRLTRHDFTQPFELEEDPKKQDRLATWIEYLNYEYWWLDKYIGDIERLEPKHDKAWQELVDAKIPRPHETKEFVRTAASGMECQTEEDQAMKAVQMAESEAKRIYVLTQEDPKRLRIPKAKRISMLKVGAEKLLAAKRRFGQIRKRNDRITEFVRATFDYADARRNAARHRVLVQWVLEQVPLIEAEMAQSDASKTMPPAASRTKRKLTNDAEPVGRRNPKKQKLDDQELDPSSRAEAPPKAEGTQPAPRDAGAIPEGPRRSARIAALQGAVKPASERDTSQPRPPSWPTAKVAQPPRSHLSAGSTKALTGTKRELQSVGRRGVAKPAAEVLRRRRRRRRGR